MADPLPTFRLGIIGGCMSHQRGTPLKDLYHRRLAVLLEAEPGIRLLPRIVRAFGSDLSARLAELDAEPRVDGVLVHLRAAPLIAPVPILRRVWRDGRLRTELSPALFGHRGSGTEVDPDDDAYGDSPDLQDLPPPGPRIAGMRVRNLNIAVGRLLGLDRQALRWQLGEFDAFERACRERDLPFFVLGPTPTTYSYWTNRIVRRADAAIREHLAGSGVPHVLVARTTDRAGQAMTRADGTHLTVEGQRFIGELLHEQGIGDWMQRIIEARRAA